MAGSIRGLTLAPSRAYAPVLYSFPRKPASKTCVAISVAGTVDPNEPARFLDAKWYSTYGK
jgi:hypothetical protein